MSKHKYITDFEALKGLVGRRVEVSPKFVWEHQPETVWVSEAEAAKRWLKKYGEAHTTVNVYRLRSRLGVVFHYETGEPEYLLGGWYYENGVLTDRHETHYTIENASSLLAARLIVLDDESEQQP